MIASAILAASPLAIWPGLLAYHALPQYGAVVFAAVVAVIGWDGDA